MYKSACNSPKTCEKILWNTNVLKVNIGALMENN